MSDKKVFCENLYKEYLDLREKTKIEIQDYKPGQDLKTQYIDPKELLKKEEVRLKLLECKDILELKPDEWFEIESE